MWCGDIIIALSHMTISNDLMEVDNNMRAGSMCSGSSAGKSTEFHFLSPVHHLTAYLQDLV